MVKLPYRPKRAFLSSAIFLPPTGELNSQLTACAPNKAVRARPFTLIHRLLSYIITSTKKTFKNEQRNRDDTAKKRVNTSGVGESINYYEDIYNNYDVINQN